MGAPRGQGCARHGRGVGHRAGVRRPLRARGRAGRRSRRLRAAGRHSTCRRTRPTSRSSPPTCATRRRSRPRSTRRSPSTAARRGRHRGGRRRRRPGAPARSRRVATRARHQSHRHVPRVQARDRAHARTAARRRRARQRRDDRERRRARGHGGRQLVQRVEGRGRDLHEEPRDRLRPVRYPRPT